MDALIEPLAILAIGFGAGAIGGLTGLGGSIIMLPGLAFVLGFADDSHVEQHLYMASAMLVNFLVAVPATWRHHKAGAIRRDVLVRLLPPSAIAMVGGVLLSNRLDPELLIKLLAGMIVVFVVVGELSERLLRRTTDDAGGPLSTASARAVTGSGVMTGVLAGLLGIGGGVIMVASLRAVAVLPVRAAIAASAAAMCLIAPIGAGVKLATLSQHGLSAIDAVRITGIMGPAAVLGALLGSSLVHRLPRTAIRWVVNAVLLLAAARLAGVL